MRAEFDVVVVGAGPAGSCAAIVLAKAGLHTALVHRTSATFQTGECLPPDAKPLLRELGLFQRFEQGPHLPCFGNASAWGSDELAYTDFIRHPQGHAWHLDRPAFDAMLRSAAIEAGAQSCESEPSALRVIDCTGRAAAFARQAGAKRQVVDHLLSHVAVFENSDTEAITLIEAVDSGWWYTAAIPGSLRVAAFHTDAGSAADLSIRGPGGYETMLARTRHISKRLRSGTMTCPARTLPANTLRLDRFTGPNWLAAGDAAIAWDPLSSQGILSAMNSGRQAALAVIADLGGDTSLVRNYRSDLESRFTNYLATRRSYYAMESRWLHDTFWSNRALE